VADRTSARRPRTWDLEGMFGRVSFFHPRFACRVRAHSVVTVDDTDGLIPIQILSHHAKTCNLVDSLKYPKF